MTKKQIDSYTRYAIRFEDGSVTLATPPITSTERKVLGIEVYKGQKGEELFTQFIPITKN